MTRQREREGLFCLVEDGVLLEVVRDGRVEPLGLEPGFREEAGLVSKRRIQPIEREGESAWGVARAQ